MQRQNLLRRIKGGNRRYPAAAPEQLADQILLGSEVPQDDMGFPLPKAFRFPARDQRDGRFLPDIPEGLDDFFRVGGRSQRQKAVHGAVIAQAARQGACVDPVQPRNSLFF